MPPSTTGLARRRRHTHAAATEATAANGQWTARVTLLCALFLSGVGAIVNQTVMQRAIKVYCSGSEAISAMLVVMVFMLGLSAGSLFMGRNAHKIRNALLAFAMVEGAIAFCNFGFTGILRHDLSESIYAFQNVAVSLGVPLRLLYCLTAAVILSVPCFLMGLTTPIASEAFQRQLGCTNSSFISFIFFLNTLGAVAGAVAGGFYLMPYHGQSTALLWASFCNLTAALLAAWLVFGAKAPSGAFRKSKVSRSLATGWNKALTQEESLSFFLGFLSLSYEMHLFRLFSLAHQPLPYHFSAVLAGFLFFWSVGVFIARYLKEQISRQLLVSAVLLAVVPTFHELNRRILGPANGSLFLSLVVYCIPCLSFGVLFGQVGSRYVRRWGNDVGKYTCLNTLGSCFGILCTIFIGFEANVTYTAWVLALGYLAACLLFSEAKGSAPAWRSPKIFARAAGFVLLAILTLPASLKFYGGSKGAWTAPKAYFGKDGVIEMFDGQIYWDGLWHSSLSENNNHIVSKNWCMAVMPALCHQGAAIDDVAVIGLGTGITAGTLANAPFVKTLDVFDINESLKQLLLDFPAGTLHVADNPKINFIWRDGRSGLALSPKKYDLITQQPMYLKQAGSSVLLSYEHMKMVSQKLKKNGIFAVYSNSMGVYEQALLVRRTVKDVFPYYESFFKGYLIVASNDPFVYTRESIEKRLKETAWAEVAGVDREKLLGTLDTPRLDWDAPYRITDDHPLVEYPDVATRLLSGK